MIALLSKWKSNDLSHSCNDPCTSHLQNKLTLQILFLLNLFCFLEAALKWVDRLKTPSFSRCLAAYCLIKGARDCMDIELNVDHLLLKNRQKNYKDIGDGIWCPQPTEMNPKRWGWVKRNIQRGHIANPREDNGSLRRVLFTLEMAWILESSAIPTTTGEVALVLQNLGLIVQVGKDVACVVQSSCTAWERAAGSDPVQGMFFPVHQTAQVRRPCAINHWEIWMEGYTHSEKRMALLLEHCSGAKEEVGCNPGWWFCVSLGQPLGAPS